MTLVKICGVRDAETALAVAKAGADFIGLVCAESKRQVSNRDCAEIVGRIHGQRRGQDVARFEGPVAGEVRQSDWLAAWADAFEDALFRWRPLIVGVFADQPAEEVSAIAQAARLDLVHLSGNEGPSFTSHLDVPAWRAFHVGSESTVDEVYEFAGEGGAAGIMLDTAANGLRGGSGETFDWALAAEAWEHIPLVLAAGLTPENVGEAVQAVRPWAVDVSSGVETDGQKDVEKIAAFIRAAKGARVGG